MLVLGYFRRYYGFFVGTRRVFFNLFGFMGMFSELTGFLVGLAV